MTIEVLADAPAVAHRGARWLAERARAVVAARGRFILGLSGGTTPALMLRELAGEDLPWEQIDIVQVDERLAPFGAPERNLTMLHECLRAAPRALERIHAMPVESADRALAAQQYSDLLVSLAGNPPALDVVHLGLGADGHTASLVPGDPVLDIEDADFAWSASYQGRVRMTMTLPMLNRAQWVLWLVTGKEKHPALVQLLRGDPSVPAGRIQRYPSVILADRAANGDEPRRPSTD